MPLYLTGAHSSRVTKPRVLERTNSLPFASTKRTHTLHRNHTVANPQQSDNFSGSDQFEEKPAESLKSITILENNSKDVLSAIKLCRSSMFDELPERAGMNSVRIAEVLNFQKNLPSTVSLAHVHALRSASTRTEREVQSLLSTNTIRRLKLVGRGNEISGLSELLIPTDAYEAAMTRAGVPPDVLLSISNALKANPRLHTLPSSSIPRAHAEILTRAGFLVAPSIESSRGYSRSSSLSIIAPSVVSKSAAGSQGAVGGDAAFETVGGINGARRPQANSWDIVGTDYVLSIPGLAAYLQLLEAGRNHFLNLLRQFSKYRQAPLYSLRERWNGNIDDDTNQVSIARRMRGDFANVLPAKTKKWKTLSGVSFDWIVEECLGAGLIELFDTQSVGMGVKALV